MDLESSFTPRLIALPLEILVMIFNEIISSHPQTFLGCRQVCHHFQSCINNSVSLQLAIKLKICCYESVQSEANHSHHQSSSVLQSLETHMNKWKNIGL